MRDDDIIINQKLYSINNKDKTSDNIDNVQNIKNDIQIAVAPCEDINENTTVSNVGISVKIPDITTRKSVDMVCVIDISGSMSDFA